MRFVVRIDKERCKGCELCVAVCKFNSLKTAHEMNSKGYHYAAVAAPGNCKGCRKCAIICPDAAIEIDKED